MPETNIEMLARVAHGLRDLKNNVVFVGGSVAELYAVSPELSDIRPTLDVDCVVKLASKIEFDKLEEELRVLGFHNDTTMGAPICRKIYQDIIVDIMPIDSDILGFSNRWYCNGVDNKIVSKLPDGTNIYIFPVEYYIATKLEAMHSRGGRDIRLSHDWEDIVYVIDNSPNLVDAIKQSNDQELVTYLRNRFDRLLNNPNIWEIIYSALPYGAENEHVYSILSILTEIGR
jgi:hypothetical protein